MLALAVAPLLRRAAVGPPRHHSSPPPLPPAAAAAVATPPAFSAAASSGKRAVMYCSISVRIARLSCRPSMRRGGMPEAPCAAPTWRGGGGGGAGREAAAAAAAAEEEEAAAAAATAAAFPFHSSDLHLHLCRELSYTGIRPHSLHSTTCKRSTHDGTQRGDISRC